MSREGAEKGETESEAGSRFLAVSTEPDTGLELTNCEIMTGAEVRCLTDWAIQAPLNLYFWERVRAGEGQREEEDAESEAGSRLWAVSTDPGVGLKLMDWDIMTWAKVGHLTDWAPWAPQDMHGLLKIFCRQNNFDFEAYILLCVNIICHNFYLIMVSLPFILPYN